MMSDHSLQLASAIVLADSAVEMLLDAAAVLKDAGETTERQALSSVPIQKFLSSGGMHVEGAAAKALDACQDVIG